MKQLLIAHGVLLATPYSSYIRISTPAYIAHVTANIINLIVTVYETKIADMVHHISPSS